jgi:hypothetical protein
MKALALVLLLMALASAAFATPVVVVATKVTAIWDPVTKQADGTPIPSGVTLTYDLFLSPPGDAGPLMYATGITSAAGTLVTLPVAWTAYAIGVRAVLTSQGVTINSAVTWSDVGGTPSPFYCFSGQPPAPTVNLRVQ